jgi:hypothetical protein
MMISHEPFPELLYETHLLAQSTLRYMAHNHSRHLESCADRQARTLHHASRLTPHASRLGRLPAHAAAARTALLCLRVMVYAEGRADEFGSVVQC